MTTIEQPPIRTPIDDYLARQRERSAVEVFSEIHDRHATGDRWYRDLLPADAPGPGEQYRFEVDMDACTGCKSCVAACHSLNGLDEDESWRTVGVVAGTTADGPTLQTVTTACHHCADPGCLDGCPVDAYEKDPVTGIVRHLDDQCIGCTYCLWTCPYDVPQFNERLGVVRKCDMCTGRLEVGEAPACVQACPNGAIAIGVVKVDEVAPSAADALLPGAPSSAITRPTTEYRRSRPLPADSDELDIAGPTPAHAHTPLVVMLVATQASAGLALVTAVATIIDSIGYRVSVTSWWSAAALTIGGLVASLTHLGRPTQAWRAVVGVGHSWLSREIVAFGAFAPLVVATGLAHSLEFDAVAPPLRALTALTGIVAVGCSAMIYAATRRQWWRLAHTAAAFATTTVAIGAALTLTIWSFDPATGRGAAGSLAAVVAAGALSGPAVDRAVRRADATPVASRALLDGTFAGRLRTRRSAAIGATVAAITAVVLWSTVLAPIAAAVALATVVVAEVTSRRTFFEAMTAPHMPGGRR